MPIYVYECDKGWITELNRSLAEREETIICPCCGRDAYRQITAPGGFKFKGNGFYATDYKKRS